MMPEEIFTQSQKPIKMKALTYIALGVIGLATIAAVNPAPTTRIEFDALESYPEGITFDKVANVYYVSSARLGNIGTVTPTGVYSVLHADTTLKSTYGLKIHPDGKRLFACGDDK